MGMTHVSKIQAKKQALSSVNTAATVVTQEVFSNEVLPQPAEAKEAPLGDHPLWQELLQEIQNSRGRDQACENTK
jgi:hypothetical protein